MKVECWSEYKAQRSANFIVRLGLRLAKGLLSLVKLIYVLHKNTKFHHAIYRGKKFPHIWYDPAIIEAGIGIDITLIYWEKKVKFRKKIPKFPSLNIYRDNRVRSDSEAIQTLVSPSSHIMNFTKTQK